MGEDFSDRIRVRAYELWEQHGRPDGADLQFWLAAERELIRPNTEDRVMNASDDNPTPPGHEPEAGRGPKEGKLSTETVKGDKGDNPTPPGHEPEAGRGPKEGKLSTETVKDNKGDNPTPPGQDPGSTGTLKTEGK